MPILTLNNVVWVNISAVLFDKSQQVVKTSTAGRVPVCYEVVNLLIEPQNFLLMSLICKLKGFYLIFTVCDDLLMVFLHFVCKLLPNLWEHHFAAMLSEVFCFWLLTSSYIPSSLM